MATLTAASTRLGVVDRGLATTRRQPAFFLVQSSGLQTENLQSLTEGLLEGTYAFQSLVQGHLEGCAEPPADVLSAAVRLVHEARVLLFWLNRYLGLLLSPSLGWLVRGPSSSLASSGAWERRTELGCCSDVVELAKRLSVQGHWGAWVPTHPQSVIVTVLTLHRELLHSLQVLLLVPQVPAWVSPPLGSLPCCRFSELPTVHGGWSYLIIDVLMCVRPVSPAPRTGPGTS